jgi:peptidoglycan/LPS O-acetylase OafA/YrhL
VCCSRTPASGVTATTSPSRVPTLTGLRAVAALLVVGTHAAFATGKLTHGYVGSIYAHIAWFAGGMALAVLEATGARCHATLAIGLAIVLYLAVSAQDTASAPVTKSLMYAAIATLAVAPAALGSPGGYGRLLSTRPMVWLGEISYEIFLLHVPIMAVTMYLVLRWPLFTGSLPGLIAATLALTIPAAWALHRHTVSRTPTPAAPEVVPTERAPGVTPSLSPLH